MCWLPSGKHGLYRNFWVAIPSALELFITALLKKRIKSENDLNGIWIDSDTLSKQNILEYNYEEESKLPLFYNILWNVNNTVTNESAQCYIDLDINTNTQHSIYIDLLSQLLAKQKWFDNNTKKSQHRLELYNKTSICCFELTKSSL
jgi:hypothetical protein